MGWLDFDESEPEGFEELEVDDVSGGEFSAVEDGGGGDHGVGFAFSSATGFVEILC